MREPLLSIISCSRNLDANILPNLKEKARNESDVMRNEIEEIRSRDVYFVLKTDERIRCSVRGCCTAWRAAMTSLRT